MKAKLVLYSFIIMSASLIFSFSTVMAQETSDVKDWEFNLATFYIWGVTIVVCPPLFGPFLKLKIPYFTTLLIQ